MRRLGREDTLQPSDWNESVDNMERMVGIVEKMLDRIENVECALKRTMFWLVFTMGYVVLHLFGVLR